MSKNQPRDPWASAMIDVGAVNPRIPSQPSWRQLASMAGLATKTVIDAANGDATATPDTIRAIARALKVDVETVSAWISDERIVSSRYTPPSEAALLTDRQRKALTELIRSMVTDEQRAGEEHEQRSAPMNDAGVSPANVRPIRPAPKPSAAPKARAARGGADDRQPEVPDDGA